MLAVGTEEDSTVAALSSCPPVTALDGSGSCQVRAHPEMLLGVLLERAEDISEQLRRHWLGRTLPRSRKGFGVALFC
jgi:hypothetical protein